MSDLPTARPSSPARKVFLGIAIVAAVGLLACLGLYWWLTSRDWVTTDPEKVRAMLAEIAPGAEMPSGYHGMGIDMLGNRMVMLFPSTVPLDTPTRGATDVDMMIAVSNIPLANQSFTGTGVSADTEAPPTFESAGTEVFAVGDTEVTFEKKRIVLGERASMEYTARLPTERTTVVRFYAQEDRIDRAAVDALLGSVLGTR